MQVKILNQFLIDADRGSAWSNPVRILQRFHPCQLNKASNMDFPNLMLYTTYRGCKQVRLEWSVSTAPYGSHCYDFQVRAACGKVLTQNCHVAVMHRLRPNLRGAAHDPVCPWEAHVPVSKWKVKLPCVYSFSPALISSAQKPAAGLKIHIGLTDIRPHEAVRMNRQSPFAIKL